MDRKLLPLLSLLLSSLLTFAACRVQTPAVALPPEPERENQTGSVEAAEPIEPQQLTPDNCEPHPLRALIVDGAETGTLVLVDEAHTYVIDTAGVPVYLDGVAADAPVLEDGMTVLIDCLLEGPGAIAEAYSINAFSLGTTENPGGTLYDLCGLYLQVLEDLWKTDAGLNGGIQYISVDLSDAPGELSDGAKAAVASIFANRHGAEPLTLSLDELREQGYLTPDGGALGYWEDGELFVIRAGSWSKNETYSLPVVKFDAYKWRSGIGGYYFSGCKASWPEMGTWSGYSIGSEAIS